MAPIADDVHWHVVEDDLTWMRTAPDRFGYVDNGFSRFFTRRV